MEALWTNASRLPLGSALGDPEASTNITTITTNSNTIINIINSSSASGGGGDEEEGAGEEDLDVNTDMYTKLLVTLLYLFIFAVGTVGNGATIYVVARKKTLQQQLQSTAHYHLVSLAVSDVLILVVSMPVEVYSFIWFHHPWTFGSSACKAYYYLRDACTYATVLNICSLSAERYLAVCHPLRAKALMSRQRAKALLGLVWVASFLLALPMLFAMGTVEKMHRKDGTADPSGVVCTNVASELDLKIILQMNALTAFLLPMLLVWALNSLIARCLLLMLRGAAAPGAGGGGAGGGLRLQQGAPRAAHRAPSHGDGCGAPGSPRGSGSRGASQGPGALRARGPRGDTESLSLGVSLEPSRVHALRHGVAVLRAIVVAFVVCWLPYHSRRLMYCYVPKDWWTLRLNNFYHYFYMLTNALFYVSSAVNPVLYYLVSASFRSAFLATLHSLALCGRPWRGGSAPRWGGRARRRKGRGRCEGPSGEGPGSLLQGDSARRGGGGSSALLRLHGVGAPRDSSPNTGESSISISTIDALR
ncbi:neurotensin receptor type 1-like [Petromyzon marinus]|uniref:Neurotensin receptor type 1-like n=1 Tax=Petromyzon marinus TaxID=7757 RepID=A0AAJ7T5G7_PETMA|nr:neurotensin receptor type 1-like [Petromyzon marinus]XP_032810467.1 neurotensin receptor type 1-like [Petromyzon marinus]